MFFRWLSRSIFFTGLIFTSVINFPSLINGYEGPKVFWFQRWVEILCLLAIGKVFYTKNKPKTSLVLISLLLTFFLWNYVTSYLGADFYTSFYGLPWRGQGLITLAHYLALATVLPIIFTRKDLSFIGMAIGFAGVIMGIVMLGPFLGKMIFDTPIYLYLGRPVGSFGNPNFLGGFEAVTLPFIWYFEGWWRRGLALVITGATLLLTRSKGAILGVLIVGLGWGLFKLVGGKKLMVILTTSILIVGVAVLGFSLWRVPTKENNWPQSRQRIFGRAVLAFYKRPITGYGLENYEPAVKDINYPQTLTETGEVHVDKAHNEVLEILVSSGLVGFGIWIGVVTLTTRSLYRAKVYLPLLAFLVLVIRMQGNVVSTMEYGLFWILVGLGGIFTDRNPHKSLSEVDQK